jgi:hypothetical protein
MQRRGVVKKSDTYGASWAVLVVSEPCGSTNHEIYSPNSRRDKDRARARCLLGDDWRLLSLARQSGGLTLVAEGEDPEL